MCVATVQPEICPVLMNGDRDVLGWDTNNRCSYGGGIICYPILTRKYLPGGWKSSFHYAKYPVLSLKERSATDEQM